MFVTGVKIAAIAGRTGMTERMLTGNIIRSTITKKSAENNRPRFVPA
jgi:hypothetical protein